MADLSLMRLMLISEIAEDEEVSTVLLEEICRNKNVTPYIAAKCILKERHVRITDYASIIVPQYSDEDFRMHFRMSRNTASKLAEEIGQMLSRCKKVSMETKILSSLWILSNQESFRGVADRFGMEKGQLHRIFIEFCEAVVSISQRYIEWPSITRADVIMKTFEDTSSIPNVIGCIDGSYINLSGQTQECRASYINRKGNSSVHLQAVCDHEMKFLDVYTGWPGSVHDSRVFKASPLFTHLEQNGIVNDGHILGDSAYPLQNYLLTPYRDNGHLNNIQKRYNFLQSSCRSIIERTFALLKGKFRRLKYLDMQKIEKVPDVIMAACVLHNFILQHDSPSIIEFDLENCDMSLDEPCDTHGQSEKSCTKRNRIANLL